MTTGTPWRIIVRFFVPLFIGDLFQQLYSLIDAIVVGRFVGTDAFAAVGSSSAVTAFATSVLLGLAMGASAVFSQLYGGKKYAELRRAICTALVFVFCVSVAMAVSASIFLPEIIQLYQMPAEASGYASQFLSFAFPGFVFVGMYNAFAFLLRAFGDARTPLYFLAGSCVLNIVLDLVFVLGFHAQVIGVAAATFVSQGAAAVGCGIACKRHLRFLRFERADLAFRASTFGRVAGYAVLTALQQSLSSFGMMLVQGLVNTFGATTMAAFSAASKIDMVANCPLQDLGNALSTYTAQNEGAGQTRRIHQGFKAAAVLIVCLSSAIGVFATVFAPFLMTVFIDRSAVEAIDAGVGYLRTVAPFYVLLGFIVAFYGFFRGLGAIRISIVMTLVSQGLRVVLAGAFAPLAGFSSIGWAIVVGWLVSDILGFALYRWIMADRRRAAPSS